jgi:hypothetical protein
MRDKYWAMYAKLVDAKYYYWHYRNHATFGDLAINIFLCVTSISGIASWMIWRQFPWVWAIVVGAAQVANAIRGFLPFKKQKEAVISFAPELEHLINEVERSWNLINLGIPDSEIVQMIFEYNEMFTSIENKYINEIYFPVNKRLLNKSSKDRIAYFFQIYDIEETKSLHKGDMNNGKQSTAERKSSTQTKSDTRKTPDACSRQ